MNFIDKIKSRGSMVGEMWSFLKERKKWWLLPILFVLLIVGGLIVLGQISPLAPLIYTLF